MRASHEEARELLETLDRVEQLRLAYDVELLRRAAPWIEQARDAVKGQLSARELERVRRGLEQSLIDIAGSRADALVAEHEPRIDELVRRFGTLTGQPSRIAALIVDPRSPDVPLELCTRVWPLSVDLASSIARDLREAAPGTSEWLLSPGEPDEHRVVAFTLGRIMRTTRRVPSYADT